MRDVDSTIGEWRTAGEAGDAAAAIACLAPTVVFISPLTEAFRFRGVEQVGEVLTAAFEVFTDIHFHTEVGVGETRALFLTGKVRGLPVDEAQLLRLDEAGLISELTFFGRPLPGVTAVMTEIAGPLLRKQGRPLAARLLTAATAPLAALTKFGEKRLVPLADPARAKR